MQRKFLTLALTAALASMTTLAHASFDTATVTQTPDAATVSKTFTFDHVTFTGFQFSTLTGYGTGTLTSVSINATLNASEFYTYANDLTIYVSSSLNYGGQLQVGGFSDLQASETHAWANGDSDAVGTKVIDTVTLTTPLTFSGAGDPNIYLGNGYGDPDASGTWTGSVTLNFTTAAAAVPEPASWALMMAGAAGLAAFTRRRRA